MGNLDQTLKLILDKPPVCHDSDTMCQLQALQPKAAGSYRIKQRVSKLSALIIVSSISKSTPILSPANFSLGEKMANNLLTE